MYQKRDTHSRDEEGCQEPMLQMSSPHHQLQQHHQQCHADDQLTQRTCQHNCL